MRGGGSDWLRGFVGGRLGLWQTAAVVWAVAAVVLMVQAGVWRGLHGMDTDDAMRLVQVRDWLAGQGWYDTTQHRGDPPAGFSMHWSRIPDVPIAGLMAIFGVGLRSAAAEFAAMAVWPLLQLFPALLLAGAVGGALGGRRAETLSMAMFGLAGAASILFFPGRIDHHGLQVIGTLAMTAAALRLRAASPWSGLAAGLAGAFTFAVGLEALPYWLVICAYMGLRLALDGDRTRRPVAAFGLTLAVATPLFALATNPPRYVLSAACDQVAYPTLGLAVAGGLGLALAAFAAGRVRTPAGRLALVAVAGLAAAAAFVLLGPHCVRGPMADLDPRVKPIWIDLVNEAISLPEQLRLLEAFGFMALSVIVLGTAALAVLASGPARRDPRAWLVAALFAVASLLTLVQARTATYALAFACPLMAAATASLVLRLRVPLRHRTAVLLAGALVGAASPGAAGAVATLLEKAQETPAEKAKAVAAAAPGAVKLDCYDPETYDPLRPLAPGLAAAPIDSGPFILMRSGLSVLSAPYHRNARGMLTAQAILTAPPAAAERLVRERGVRYVVICHDGPSTNLLTKTAPHGLAARLDAGATPAWLQDLPRSPGPLRAYRVR